LGSGHGNQGGGRDQCVYGFHLYVGSGDGSERKAMLVSACKSRISGGDNQPLQAR
jgi:hypothetical protein